VNYAAARQAGLEVREIPDVAAWERARELLARQAIALDALLGTGVRGGAHGVTARAIDDLNASGLRVASIDLPSGANGDSGDLSGSAVVAEHTYTLCRPKRCLVLEPAASSAGRWRVIPIGIPEEAVSAVGSRWEWIDGHAASRLLPRRVPDAHKGHFGHLLAVAGSSQKSGAAVLLARGALRCGVGLITVATPASAQERIAVQQAEVMTEALAQTSSGRLSRAAREQARELSQARDALAIGPGLGTGADVDGLVSHLLDGNPVPAVVDADGLNALVPGGPSPKPATSPVLTPHPGEAARLLDSSPADIQRDRPTAARELARRHGAVAVLKGHRTVIAGADGRLAFNASGNPGMATAGTGDVLTGAIGAFLARGLEGWSAARLAVYAHGSAGDRAAARLGQDGMIAGDLIAELPAVLGALTTGAEIA
jgi:NAD(P)H-hydrate epimerase